MGVVLCEKEKEAETKRRWNRRGRTRLLLSEEELESQRRRWTLRLRCLWHRMGGIESAIRRLWTLWRSGVSEAP
jgi:hypothetical protein